MLHQIKQYLVVIDKKCGYSTNFDIVSADHHTYTQGNVIHLVIHDKDNNQRFYAMDIILIAAIHELAHVIRNSGNGSNGSNGNSVSNGSNVESDNTKRQSSHERSHERDYEYHHDRKFNEIEEKLIRMASSLKYLDVNWLSKYWGGDNSSYPCFSH